MPQKHSKSKAQGFTHGLVSDSDPRFQIKGSYSDAQNIRLTNSTGDTFTVENINGNSLFIDLYALSNQSKLDAWNDNSSGMLGTRPDIPALAAAPVPVMIAVGVARPSAQGQAITRTQTPFIMESSRSPPINHQPTNVITANITTPGTNTSLTRSTTF